MANQVFTSLNDGFKMPALGLGTFDAGANDQGDWEYIIKKAIDLGYRHIDTAWINCNEEEIGRAIRAKIEDGTVQREELFITTKLWNNFHAKESVMPKLRESLQRLQLDYVDLFVMHWPMAFKEKGRIYYITEENVVDLDYLETWSAMEECVDESLTRSIGLGNFNAQQVDRIVSKCRIKPVTNYIEVNPYFNQKELIAHCRKYEIVVTGYCPMACDEGAFVKGFAEKSFNNPDVQDIANRYGKTQNQVVLNYMINHLRITVAPKTLYWLRLEEHFNCLDFILDPKDVSTLDSLNMDRRHCPYFSYSIHPLYPFESKQ